MDPNKFRITQNIWGHEEMLDSHLFMISCRRQTSLTFSNKEPQECRRKLRKTTTSIPRYPNDGNWKMESGNYVFDKLLKEIIYLNRLKY